MCRLTDHSHSFRGFFAWPNGALSAPSKESSSQLARIATFLFVLCVKSSRLLIIDILRGKVGFCLQPLLAPVIWAGSGDIRVVSQP